MAKYKRNESIRFVNPYNFIRLSNENYSIKREKSDDDHISGVIKCKLITKTPLCIPDVEKKKEDQDVKNHFIYPFFSVGEKENKEYIIPGSSIRGVIRSMHETLTGSCFVTLPDEYNLTLRTTSMNPFFPGILKKDNGEWKLFKAERKPIRLHHEVKNGERVFIQNNKTYHYGEFIKYNGLEGYLYIGEPFSRKKKEGIFVKKEQIETEKEQLKKSVQGLKQTIHLFYQNESINRNLGNGWNNHLGYKGLEKALDSGCAPVWYKIENGHIYLSAAAIGRRAFETTVNDMLKKSGHNYNPCLKRSNACPSCQLFGMAKGEAMGGRVRFSDARMEKGNIKKNITLKELGSPRTGYLPFYSENGMDYDESGAMICGRKFYWHNSNAADSTEAYKESGRKTNRNATVDLFNTGSEFLFDVYFDNITPAQLKELEWAITLGKDENLCHKIGHGKPLGLGSVKIQIDKIQKRIKSSEKYEIINQDIELDDTPEGFQKEVLEQIKLACDFNAISENIAYPYVKLANNISKTDVKPNALANHQWFSSNKGRNKNDLKPQVLKPVGEEQVLYGYELVELNSRNNFQKRNPKKGNNHR
ncbi:CRISPR-associated protein [Lachnospiraceae bacterium C10]|nr:CRISPR-associated protein [Lachnospiraceae bacterium C10]